MVASPSSMLKDRERLRHRYHDPRAHKRARARRNGWPSSPRMPHNGRETPEVRRHDALSTGLVMTENARGKLNKGGGKISGGCGGLGGSAPEPGDASEYFSPASLNFPLAFSVTTRGVAILSLHGTVTSSPHLYRYHAYQYDDDSGNGNGG